MNKQYVEKVQKQKKAYLLNGRALLLPGWVKDNVSTVQRTETNEGR